MDNQYLPVYRLYLPVQARTLIGPLIIGSTTPGVNKYASCRHTPDDNLCESRIKVYHCSGALCIHEIKYRLLNEPTAHLVR